MPVAPVAPIPVAPVAPTTLPLLANTPLPYNILLPFPSLFNNATLPNPVILATAMFDKPDPSPTNLPLAVMLPVIDKLLGRLIVIVPAPTIGLPDTTN